MASVGTLPRVTTGPVVLLHDDRRLHVGGWLLSGPHAEVGTEPDPAVTAEAKEYTKDGPDDAGLLAVVLSTASVGQATVAV